MAFGSNAQNGQGQPRKLLAGILSVLTIILGFALAGMGAILLIACAAIMADGDESLAILLPFALMQLLGGVAIIRLQRRLNSSSSTATRTPLAESPAPAAKIALPVPAATPAPAPVAPASPLVPKPSTPTEPSPTKDVSSLVLRSSDLFATLRDLARHESKPGSNKLHLASMLEACGVLGWQDAPACEGRRLARNTHYWIHVNTADLDDEHYDLMVSAEAALSLNQDLPDVRALSMDDAEAQRAKLMLMRSMADHEVERPALTDNGLKAAYRSAHDAGDASEWLVRSLVCNAAECVRTPFRVVYDLRANMPQGLVVLSLETPRPRCMAIVTREASRQAGLARAYALRLAVLLARQAFAASKAVRTVVVNLHERASEQTLLSLELTPALVEQLASAIRSERVEESFPQSAAIRASFEGSWFEPVEPFMALNDPRATNEQARTLPELDLRPATEALRHACHAERVCDLGINENAGRIAAWEQMCEQLGTTTEQAVSTLVAARDRAADITVAEACNRTMQALVSGSADLDDMDALGRLFVNGSSLDQATRRALELLDEEHGPKAEEALAILQNALAPFEDMGIYLDGSTYVYRYFGSVAERLEHNRSVDEGGREVRLVPDSYFHAHCNASIALSMLGRMEEAHGHADILRRLAPISTFATLRKVRLLETESRIYEAADLIVAALRHAVTPHDAAICHYRLAYMQWKLGREDLAAACYQRSLAWDTEVSEQAEIELADLVESVADLERPTAEQADALLAREGIPLGCTKLDQERTLAAAVACMDHEALYTAYDLVATLFSAMHGDDVLAGIYRSLKVLS